MYTPGDLVKVDYPLKGWAVGVIVRRVGAPADREDLMKFYDWWILVEGEMAAYPNRALTPLGDDDEAR
jgi:hypothetical protein